MAAVQHGVSSGFAYGAYAIQGRRDHMEDFVLVVEDLVAAAPAKAVTSLRANNLVPRRSSLWAVFDGHQGALVSDWLHKNFTQAFWTSFAAAIVHGAQPIDKLMVQVFERCARECEAGAFAAAREANPGGRPRPDGSCVLACVLWDDHLFVSSIGDSVAFVFDGSKPTVLSVEHCPKNPVERERIRAKGLKVHEDGDNWKILPSRSTITRSIGDFSLKQDDVLIATPETRVYKLETSKHKFLVVGSDGLFEKTNAGLLSQAIMKSGFADMGETTKALVNTVHAGGSTDNISAIVVAFK